MKIAPNDFYAFQAYHKKYKKTYAIELIRYTSRATLSEYNGVSKEGSKLMISEIVLIGPDNMKKRRYTWDPRSNEGDIRDLVILKLD